MTPAGSDKPLQRYEVPTTGPPSPGSIALGGAIVSALVVIAVEVFLDEYVVSLASFGIGVGAGITAGSTLWVVVVMLNRWQLRIHDRDQQHLHIRRQLIDAQSQIFEAQQPLRRAIGPEGSWDEIHQTIDSVKAALRPLGIDGPTHEDAECDPYLYGSEWEWFLRRLYPLARDGDIKRARRLCRGWRFELRFMWITWRYRVRNGLQRGWRVIAGFRAGDLFRRSPR